MEMHQRLFNSFISKSQNNPESQLEWRLLSSFNEVWRQSNESTLQGCLKHIEGNIDFFLKNIDDHPVLENRSIITLKAISDMYSFAMKRNFGKNKTVEERNQSMIEMGDLLIKNFSNCKDKIFKLSQHVIKANDTVLVIGYSSLIANVLIKMKEKQLNLNIKVMELRPECDGHLMYSTLSKAGVHSELISDSLLGIEMEKVDYVLTGAEAITENGGIINRSGTYTAAIVAKSMQKPVYVLAEIFKAIRIFPYSTKDLPFASHSKN
jgi:translation initiation factor eIF-2B subunit alpha